MRVKWNGVYKKSIEIRGECFFISTVHTLFWLSLLMDLFYFGGQIITNNECNVDVLCIHSFKNETYWMEGGKQKLSRTDYEIRCFMRFVVRVWVIQLTFSCLYVATSSYYDDDGTVGEFQIIRSLSFARALSRVFSLSLYLGVPHFMCIFECVIWFQTPKVDRKSLFSCYLAIH